VATGVIFSGRGGLVSTNRTFDTGIEQLNGTNFNGIITDWTTLASALGKFVLKGTRGTICTGIDVFTSLQCIVTAQWALAARSTFVHIVLIIKFVQPNATHFAIRFRNASCFSIVRTTIAPLAHCRPDLIHIPSSTAGIAGDRINTTDYVGRFAFYTINACCLTGVVIVFARGAISTCGGKKKKRKKKERVN